MGPVIVFSRADSENVLAQKKFAKAAFGASAGLFLAMANFSSIGAPAEDSTATAKRVAEPLPALTHAAEVKRLSVEEAKRGFPVRLSAVVTYVDSAWDMFFVQDQSDGIFVFSAGLNLDWKQGQLVELEGITRPGNFAPIVSLSKDKSLGQSTMPASQPTSRAELMTGKLDSQWTEIKGIVHALSIDDGHLVLDFVTDGGRLSAFVPGFTHRAIPEKLIDSGVRIQGVCSTMLNEKKQLKGIQLCIPSLSFIEVIEAAPSDPFSISVRPIGTLFRFNPKENSGHRVKIRGVVTLQRSGRSLFVRDESGSIYLQTAQKTAVQPGDEVEAIGFPVVNNTTPELDDCEFKKVGTGPAPEPIAITPDKARSGSYDAVLVRMEGRLVTRSERHPNGALILSSGSTIFEAQLEPGTKEQKLADYREGSQLSIAGICSMYGDQESRSSQFRILMRSPKDVDVLARSPWWTVERSLAALAAVALGGLAAIGWGTAMRRQVARQTAIIRERLERETALEERYRQLVENASDIVFTCEMTGLITSLNKVGREITGYDVGQTSKITLEQLVAPECRKSIKRLLADTTPENDSSFFELKFVTKSGGRVPVEVSSRTLAEKDGPTSVQCIARNISERKRIEEAQRVMESLYHRAIAAAEAVPYRREYDPPTFAFIGDGIFQMTGFTATEMTPRRWDGLVQEMEMKGELTGMTPEIAIERARSGKVPNWRADYRIRTRSGQTRWVADASIEIMGANGTPIGSIGILQDITERKKAEIEFQRLANFARFNPNPILELSAEGEIAYCNEAALKMTQQLNKNHPWEILPLGISEIVTKCLESGQSKSRVECRINDRTLSWSFFPVIPCQAVHCYAGDITDRLALESHLRQMQKIDSVGQLAAGVAHDFNNLLLVISGHTELLQQNSEINSDQAESLKQISRAAERAGGLTRQLLMFSRRQVIQPRRLDLNEIIKDISNMLRRLLGENIILQCTSEAVKPAIHADAGMIEQVLVNLAVNARDAMPKGGELTITTKIIEIDSEYVKTRLEARVGKFVCLTVRDNGSGMDATTRERIFEPFFTTKGVGKGTGLGLATIHGIVKQHDGWIEVASQLGVGTTFKIFLPTHGEPSETLTERVPMPQVRGGTETILVVEDEQPVRKLVKEILSGYGYRIWEASSGHEALYYASSNGEKIDLLLTDIVMPGGVSGLELAERFKSFKPDLKVILTSGYSSELLKEGWVVREGLAFLDKPYQPQKLAQTVRDCLDSPGKV